jgi:hypothetical protein
MLVSFTPTITLLHDSLVVRRREILSCQQEYAAFSVILACYSAQQPILTTARRVYHYKI